MLFKYASPASFYPLAGKLAPVFAVIALVLTAVGLYQGFIIAPTDFQQGEVYRIIFIHVPSAWMGMFIYLVMAMYACLALVFNTRLSAMMMQALAPTGAIMTAIALWTGALWGKPTWGTYWAWDARMTSTLFLLFLYFGYMALDNAIEDRRRADKAGALLVLVGVVNVPIIYFSVRWWNTLHQGATVVPGSSKMADTMLAAMMVMTFAMWAYAIAVALWRVRGIILEREKNTAWVQELLDRP
ncbi:MAG: cytochrome c biogenesis protein CcsA [Betaproteobacteria bacterium]|nr:cytochrome c biogenesis protein CcsA [Betaproteobacteria bacterium]